MSPPVPRTPAIEPRNTQKFFGSFFKKNKKQRYFQKRSKKLVSVAPKWHRALRMVRHNAA
jgi:hypothetical protein